MHNGCDEMCTIPTKGYDFGGIMYTHHVLHNINGVAGVCEPNLLSDNCLRVFLKLSLVINLADGGPSSFTAWKCHSVFAILPTNVTENMQTRGAHKKNGYHETMLQWDWLEWNITDVVYELFTVTQGCPMQRTFWYLFPKITYNKLVDRREMINMESGKVES